jgi:hypothetical protein
VNHQVSWHGAFARKGVVLVFASLLGAGTIPAPYASAGDVPSKPAAISDDPYTVTLQYVIEFYPLWFTYNQSAHATRNRLIGPARMTPAFHEVVAPNDDTLYVSSFLDLSQQPDVLIIPDSTENVTASLLTLDAYGNVFETTIDPKTPGKYALVGPNFSGSLPAELTPIQIPENFSQWLLRADKFSPSGVDQTADAETFRKELRIMSLSQYETNPSLDNTLIAPIALYRIRFKQIADDLCENHAISFLRQLQVAVGSPNTPPLDPTQQALVDEFNTLFGNGKFNISTEAGRELRAKFIAGTQQAHDLIIADYVTNTGATQWISFTNIGNWGTDYLDRAAITEFIQYGNGFDTAAYYQTFVDANGAPLNGHRERVYVLKFEKNQLPEAERFWSVTAYIPSSITLHPNPLDKYLVASYTPGLETAADGSVSIYLSNTQPNGVPQANWLPVPNKVFDIMLRVYGPEGSVAQGTYVPPAVQAISP